MPPITKPISRIQTKGHTDQPSAWTSERTNVPHTHTCIRVKRLPVYNFLFMFASKWIVWNTNYLQRRCHHSKGGLTWWHQKYLTRCLCLCRCDVYVYERYSYVWLFGKKQLLPFRYAQCDCMIISLTPPFVSSSFHCMITLTQIHRLTLMSTFMLLRPAKKRCTNIDKHQNSTREPLYKACLFCFVIIFTVAQWLRNILFWSSCSNIKKEFGCV